MPGRSVVPRRSIVSAPRASTEAAGPTAAMRWSRTSTTQPVWRGGGPGARARAGGGEAKGGEERGGGRGGGRVTGGGGAPTGHEREKLGSSGHSCAPGEVASW